MVNFNLYLDNLESFVCHQNKIVSYKWLSQHLKVPSNVAKKMLYAFAEKKGKEVKVIYVIAGKSKETGLHEFKLVKKDKLEAVKKQFEQISTLHIYSLQLAYPHDTNELWIPEQDQYEKAIAEGSFEQFFDNRWSTIRYENAKKKENVGNQPQSKPTITSTTHKVVNAKTATPVAKITEVVKTKQPEKKTEDKEESPKKQQAQKKGGAGMSSFFKPVDEKQHQQQVEAAAVASSSPPKKETTNKNNNTSSSSTPVAVKKEKPAAKRSTPKRSSSKAAVKKEPVADTEDDFEDIDDEPVKATPANSKRKRRIVDDSSSSSSSSESESESEEEEEEPKTSDHSDSDTPVKKENADAGAEPQEKKQRKKRQKVVKPPPQVNTIVKALGSPPKAPGQKYMRTKKVLVTKTFVNEKGYTVTKEVEEEVEVEETLPPLENTPPAKQTDATTKSTTTTAPKAAQASIKNFFTRK